MGGLGKPRWPSNRERAPGFPRLEDLPVNPIIVSELEYGIQLLPAGRRRKKLLDWFARGIQQLNVIDIDATTASTWAKLLADLKRKGKSMPIKESLIAATAKQHGLTVATRNIADFRYAGVAVIDPFTIA